MTVSSLLPDSLAHKARTRVRTQSVLVPYRGEQGQTERLPPHERAADYRQPQIRPTHPAGPHRCQSRPLGGGARVVRVPQAGSSPGKGESGRGCKAAGAAAARPAGVAGEDVEPSGEDKREACEGHDVAAAEVPGSEEVVPVVLGAGAEVETDG